MNRAAPVTRLIRLIARRLGYHPDDPNPAHFDLTGRKALVVATNHGALDIGRPTGVFASELTSAYYAFVDAGMTVDVASPAGGIIPVDPLSLRSVVRSASDDRLLGDPKLRGKIMASIPIGELDIHEYDIVYLAGGWGAAFDLGFSTVLATKITEADAADLVIGGVCHGPLGLINATRARWSTAGRGSARHRRQRPPGPSAGHRQQHTTTSRDRATPQGRTV